MGDHRGGNTSGLLDQFGVLWKENSRQVHPLQNLINYAKQSNLTPLAETLIWNQENQIATFIHKL